MAANPKPLLCYVTDRTQLTPGEALETRIRAAIAAGVDWIQVREKDLPALSLARLVSDALEATRAANAAARISVNDRLDVSLACGAHGVHLGGESMPAQEVVAWARCHAPREFSIGLSCHSLAEAKRAHAAGAHYIFLGPIFATPSKAQFGPPLGLGKLREVVSALEIPVFAIGGITPENARECIAAGARGIAAIRLFQSENIAATAAALRSAS